MQDLLVQLEEANAALTGTTVNFGSGDLIYGGDPVLWRKLANSLKLRILNRAAGTPWSFTYNMAGGTQVTTTARCCRYGKCRCTDRQPFLVTRLHIRSLNPMMIMHCLIIRDCLTGTRSLMLFIRGTDQAISETMVDWLKARTDPRIHIYAQPTPTQLTAGYS